MGTRFTLTHLGANAEHPSISRQIGSSTLSIKEPGNRAIHHEIGPATYESTKPMKIYSSLHELVFHRAQHFRKHSDSINLTRRAHSYESMLNPTIQGSPVRF